MFRLPKILLMLFIGVFALAACGQQQITAEEIVSRMQQARDTMQDVHATVAFNFVTNEHNGSLTVEGWMKKTYQTDANGKPIYKVRGVVLEASEADMVGATVVSDGNTFWAYSPKENKVVTGTRADMQNRAPTDPAGATQALQDVVQRGLDAVNLEVLGEEQVAGQNTWKVKVTPKPETTQQLNLSNIVEATMWVDVEKALPLKLDVDAKDMGTGNAEVRSIELNQGLDDSLFTFTPPAGAEVVQAKDLAEKAAPQVATLDEARAAVDFPLLTAGSTPNGATLVEVRLLGKETVIQNYAGSGVNFSLVQGKAGTGADRQPPADANVQQVTVRGQTATLITGQGGSLLRWQENGVRIVVAGSLSGNDAIAVAEGLK
ncbi:MAG: outer membrane lipoprotein-sorting protein [Chloroflexaceae bacterium]|nr:outer membrane lipoprotein-sorting protein [Chloroflexaceae bacterium]